MIKINKQVAKRKISSFLETHQVVLFFHCNNNISLYRNEYLLDLNKGKVMYQANSDSAEKSEGSHNSFSKKRGSFYNPTTVLRVYDDNETYKKQILDPSPFNYLMVNNRVAKNILLDLRIAKSSHSRSDDSFSKEDVCTMTSLFQGPTLLLGCSDIKFLERGMEIWSQHKGLLLLGALYENSIINNSQLKTVITHSNNNYGYIKLLSSMKSPFFRPFSLLRSSLSLRCLLAQQNKLICLLKMRRQQLGAIPTQ